MRKFDYSFLNNGLLPANLVNLTSNIAALKTMAGVRKDEYTQIFTELEAVAKVQSMGLCDRSPFVGRNRLSYRIRTA